MVLSYGLWAGEPAVSIHGLAPTATEMGLKLA